MKVLILSLLLSFSYVVVLGQKTPSAKAVLQQMKETVATLSTISYTSQYQSINSGIDDSVQTSSATIWVQRVASDTIFGAHFHVKQEGFSYKSEYFYDGINGIDIIHEHKEKDKGKNIVVIEPVLLGNGYNTVQSRMSVLPYFNELANPKSIDKWLEKIDSINIKEDESKKYWILEWPENSPKDNFFATRQVFVDKTSYLPHQMHRTSTWNGVRLNSHLYIKNIKINNPEDEQFVTMKESFPGYKTTYSRRKKDTTAVAEVPALTGTKAADFNYTSFTGEVVSLTNRKNKLVLLDFWETWCGYCFLAMPKLKNLYEEYNNRGLEIIGVVTENKGKVAQILQSQNFPYKTIFADNSMLENYKVVGRPTYVLIDEKGKVVEYSAGDLDKIEKAISKHLEIK